MLEKAAEALARSLGADWEMAPPSVRAKWIEGARTVIVAIRDIPHDVALAGYGSAAVCDHQSAEDYFRAWHGMVDHILDDSASEAPAPDDTVPTP